MKPSIRLGLALSAAGMLVWGAWRPINSAGRARAAQRDIGALFDDEANAMRGHGVAVGTVYFAVGKHALCIEPLLYWDDPVHFLHDRIDQRSDLTALAGHPVPPEATRYAHALRERLKAVMHKNGAVHVQIGKAYNYLATREPRVAELVRQLKKSVDPEGLVNPGSLGL